MCIIVVLEIKERLKLDANVLFEKIKVKQVKGTLNRAVDDITTDSRTATTGSIFVASKGSLKVKI